MFDFAPDRTLKMMADAVNMSTKAGKTDGGQKKAMGKLLNFCPIISIDGTNMREYDVDQMLTQLKRAYIDKVSQNGFDDAHIYNYNIGAFSEKDKEFIKHLSAIVKAINLRLQVIFPLTILGLTMRSTKRTIPSRTPIRRHKSRRRIKRGKKNANDVGHSSQTFAQFQSVFRF